jgi:hypothetical protein
MDTNPNQSIQIIHSCSFVSIRGPKTQRPIAAESSGLLKVKTIRVP